MEIRWARIRPNYSLALAGATFELSGPEYSMSWNTVDTGLKLFFSRAVQER
jgi:hypothetical protein